MNSGVLGRMPYFIGRIGIDPADSTDVALQKRLVVSLSLAIVPAAIIWSAVYFWSGAWLAGLIPGSYAILGPANTVLFAFTRRLGFYRFSQLLIFLLLPWLLMMSLGGFKNSSAVIIWAALCPLGAIILEDLRRTFYWLLGFIALLIVSAIVQPYLSPVALPEPFITWFFALNIGAVILIGFGVLYYFVGQRNFFQERAEMLLLNILPKEISEALKAEHRTIANHDDAATILFADVVNFTPMAATMTPLQLVSLLNEVFQCFDNLVEKYDLEKDQDDRRLLHGRRRRAAVARRPCHGNRRAGARHAGGGGCAAVLRREPELPDRHQLGTGGRRRDRPQEIHLRPLGRRREHGKPHGIARDRRRHPDHPRHLRTGQERLRLRGEGHGAGEGRRRTGDLACDWATLDMDESTPRPSAETYVRTLPGPL